MILFHCTPIGELGIAENGGKITAIYFEGCAPAGAPVGETPLLREAARQLDEYFAGVRREFDLPLEPAGTPYRQRVWRALLEIPYGKTATYGQIAASVGNPRASRAVGGANHHNPIPILIPCHRVVGADGTLTGYAGGMERKKLLLETERS